MAALIKNSEVLPNHFDLVRCCEFIDSGGYNSVALQFPFELIKFAICLSQELQARTGRKFFILGDSAYHSCCVDEIQAEKLSADSIIHFGNACFNQLPRIPTLFIFNEIDSDHMPLVTAFRNVFGNKDIPILLVYHTNCTKLALKLSSVLNSEFPNLECSTVASANTKEYLTNTNEVLLGRKIAPKCLSDNYQVLFVGEKGRTCLNFRLAFHTNRFYQISPEDHTITEMCKEDKLLKKRYYIMQKVEKAAIIGILVGNLWIRDYLHVLADIKTVLRQKGKEYYTISVGNIQPNKLANFLEVDIFVLLGCPENSMLDSNEFYKPIITPYELYLSLSDTHCSLLSENYQINLNNIFKSIALTGREDSSEGTSLKNNSEMNATETQLQIKPDYVVESKELYNAAAYLQNRSWQGLDTVNGLDTHSLVEEGRSGLPIHYLNEPTQTISDSNTS